MILNISVLYLWYFSVLIFAINFVSIRSDHALLFNREDYVLVQEPFIIKDETKTILKNCAFACPASTSDELKYNFKKSVSKKVLFTNIVNQSESTNEIELPECNGSIQPSIVFNIDKGLIETGYEVRDEHKIAKSLESNNNQDRLLSLYPSDPKNEPNPKDVLSKYFKSNKKAPPSKENAQSSIWIPVLSISFNIDTLSPIQIGYNPDSGTHWWRENCHRFDVGKEFYVENSVAFLYSPETQKQLFNGIKKQSTQSSKIQSVTSEEELECGQEFGCLVQHQIIPSYYFHSYYGGLATCTHMNTVPVWKSIVKRINLVDQYLYAMIQLWQPNINLKIGFFNVFKPSVEYFNRIPSPGEALYLDQRNKNISVPMILYKVVEYKMKFPLTQITDSYFAVIIIHNDPTPKSGGFKVCEGNWRVPGWEDIENEESKSGLTYVCRYNEDVAKALELEVQYGKENVGDKSPLRLDLFPTFDGDAETYDARLEIRKRVEQLEKTKL